MTTNPTTPLVMPGSAPATPPTQPTRVPRTAKPADKFGWWWGTGRRKAAVARIRMKPADAEKATVTVEAPNGKVKTIEQFFSEERDRTDAVAPLKMNGLMGRVQVICKVHGGGFMGQAAAIKLAIARAVLDYDPSFEETLRDAGMLTRDARKVERKKYGQAGARRRFQFSKR
jgi:small subunit ribosomal protein S9